jgi:hypothetical protein
MVRVEDAAGGLADPGEPQEARRPCMSSSSVESLTEPERAEEEQQAGHEEVRVLNPSTGSEVKETDGVAGDRVARSGHDPGSHTSICNPPLARFESESIVRRRQ